ncbi:MAG: hypothetical protein RMY29_006565 [Nostoc sp. CreGUA01]|nr:hypothetical protein [Nostoc sp. CreGUA01]
MKIGVVDYEILAERQQQRRSLVPYQLEQRVGQLPLQIGIDGKQ